MHPSPLSSLLKRAYYSSAGTIFSRGFAALTGIVIAGASGPAEFGIYAAAWSVMGLCCSLSDMGIVTGLKREGAREIERLPELLGNALIVKLSTLVPALAVAWVIQAIFIQDPMGRVLFLPIAVANFAMTAAEPCFAVLQVRGEQRDAAAILVIRGGVIFGVVCLLAASGGDIVAMSWCQALFSLLTVCFAMLLVLRRVSAGIALARLRRQLRRAIAFGASELINSFYQNAPVLLLIRFGTDVETGYFALVQRITGLCIVAGSTANSQAFLPALFGLYHQDRPRFRQVCAHMQRLFSAAGLALAAGLYTFAEPALALIQEGYRPAAPIMQWLCWSVFLGYAVIAADAALSAGDRMRVKVAIQAAATVGLVGLSAALAIPFGVQGVSAAVIAAAAVILVCMLGWALRLGLYPLRGMLPIALGGVLLVCSALFAAPYVAERPLEAGAYYIASMAVIGLLCFRRAFFPGGA